MVTFTIYCVFKTNTSDIDRTETIEYKATYWKVKDGFLVMDLMVANLPYDKMWIPVENLIRFRVIKDK
jgi:hypothetical protein